MLRYGERTTRRTGLGVLAGLSMLAGAGTAPAPLVAQDPFACDADEIVEMFELTGAVDFWTVPEGVESIRIIAAGGRGGNGATESAAGGAGALVAGTFAIEPSSTLHVIVGGRGSDGSTGFQTGGGGGGSFVGVGGFVFVDETNTDLLLVAGGGGGSGDSDPGGDAGLPGADGSPGAGGGGGGGTGEGTGGSAGPGDDGGAEGGGAAVGSDGADGSAGGGGAGAGGNGGNGEFMEGGTAAVDGGAGGVGGGTSGGDGGFGGGGGGANGGGGGGGFAGGGGGGNGGGGGGSSFVADSAEDENSVPYLDDDGFVTICYREPEETADLAMAKTATVNEDASVVFALEASNNGPDAASSVTVTDALPACTSYVSDTCGAGAGEPFTWVIGDLATEASASCDVTVDASGCAGDGEQTNTATVAGEQEDPEAQNDTAEASFEIEGKPAATADLSLNQEATVGPAAAATSTPSASPPATATTGAAEKPRAAANGDATVVFALTVANAGPDNATGVVVTNALPECTQIVSDTCGGAAGPPWTWTVGSLAADASASCELTVGAAQCSGAQTATAEVTADQSDPDPENNTAAASFEIEAVPALPAFALVALAALLALAATRLLQRDDLEKG